MSCATGIRIELALTFKGIFMHSIEELYFVDFVPSVIVLPFFLSWEFCSYITLPTQFSPPLGMLRAQLGTGACIYHESSHTIVVLQLLQAAKLARCALGVDEGYLARLPRHHYLCNQHLLR